ncbi:TrmO family methyltransferase domain-containing protein [Sulfitobacter geojensis]|uniref:TrmO family methyltransferase domain-containing protein n=1 Tax=Sulfitobacter geojensis TaxID=1342299 RepID=UPI00046ABEDF|nr:TrmO family methyltransferase [Sulfitobacter geojensis]NYI28212.1 tRNA-Thr(GGU) m(6)t(6)A37 methyltransferase TsaA [Sulfitobacter geojensis]
MIAVVDGRGVREGEVQLGFDPAERINAGVTFIGHIRSQWSRGDSPRNTTQGREAGGGNARIELLASYSAGLQGLEIWQPIWVLYWMDRGPRDLVVQSPRHLPEPRGVFSLRSPVRPKPIAMSAAIITSIDHETGIVGIDTTDAFDRTPVVDIKPWIAGIDVPPTS